MEQVWIPYNSRVRVAIQCECGHTDYKEVFWGGGVTHICRCGKRIKKEVKPFRKCST